MTFLHKHVVPIQETTIPWISLFFVCAAASKHVYHMITVNTKNILIPLDHAPILYGNSLK